jgi:pilus assembly protein FimV
MDRHGNIFWGANLMKGPVKLSLAVALALAGGNAFALGLGAIQVKSGLNQPLDAEIPVITESAAEANALTVDLASAEDFERIGLSRSRLTVPIEMAVGTNARGQTVIKLSTKEAVREPLLDFLLVANWSKGKLLREYTVLLDPPITAPAKSAATVAPLSEKPVPVARPLTETRPESPPPKPVRAEPKPPVAAAMPKPALKPQARTAPPPPPPAPPAPKPAAHPAGGNDYGPVAEGETLSEIARATKPDDKASVDQMMLALLKANPKAFYQDNINALKRGSILRIPTGDELHAAATLREAAEQVHNQNEAWSGRAPVSKPTLVAHAGAKPAEAAAKPAQGAPKPARQERLALVPPAAAKSDSSTDRAGAAGGTGKDSADVKAELARTKEALTSREQESAELRSRVKQLEEISTKDQRLISMKDSEIADLQKKLRDLQAKAAAPVAAVPAKTAEAAPAKPADTSAAKPAETATSKPDQKLTAKDIWGDLNAGDKNAAKPAAAAAPAATPPTATASTEPAAAAPSAATTAPPTSTPATTPPTTTPATTTAEPPASTTTGTAPAATAAVDANTAVKATPVKSPPPAKVTPLAPAAEPFYKNQNVLLGGGAALLLIGLLALMRFMRKPKPEFAMPDDAGGHDVETGADEEELRLRDALQQNPGNTSASLELLRYYYAHGDAAKFEAAAETMHAHLPDRGAPEWDEVLAMGAVLAPNHPLFSDVAEDAAHHDLMHHDAHQHAAEHYDTMHESAAAPVEEFTYPGHAQVPVEEAHTHFDSFEVEPVARAAEPHPVHDDSFDFDLPVQTEETEREPVVVHHEPEPLFTEAAAPTPVVERQDDIYVGEDAIGTKLDLAKAYLDMGDPEGAKSMLDEVLAEGNDSQRDEARRLLAEIH